MRSLVREFTCAALLWAPAAFAQNTPRRPRLPDGADTNSARLYYQLGLRQIADHPRDAEQAFYWACRLEPASADVVYGLRVARLAENEALLWAYMDAQGHPDPPAELRPLEALLVRALMLDPFVFRGPSSVLATRYIDSQLQHLVSTRPHSMTQLEFRLYLLRLFIRAQPSEASTIAYSEGRFQDALDNMARGLSESRVPGILHAERARAFMLLNAPDSAQAELEAALASPTPPVVRSVLDSREEWLYSLARVHDRSGDAAGARDLYVRVLAVDSTHWGAAMRLGLLLARTGDTTGSLATLRRAVALAPDEYAPHLAFGEALANAGRSDSAVTHLRRAIEMEAWAAVPHRLLGKAFEGMGNRVEARAEYERYLALARRDDPQLGPVREHLASLVSN